MGEPSHLDSGFLFVFYVWMVLFGTSGTHHCEMENGRERMPRYPFSPTHHYLIFLRRVSDKKKGQGHKRTMVLEFINCSVTGIDCKMWGEGGGGNPQR